MRKQDLEQLTLFPAASPVSRSVLPGSEEARRMTVTSGLKCLELYQNSGPLGSLVRMLLGSSIWRSTRCNLENEGYTVQALIIPACAVDAPHRRDRCSIVAYCNNRQRITEDETIQAGRTSVDYGGEDVADAESDGLQGKRPSREQVSIPRPEKAQSERRCDVLSDTDNSRRALRRNWELPAAEETQGQRTNHGGRAPEYVAGEWWPAEPGLGGVATRVPYWLDGSVSAPGCWMLEPPGIPRITARKENRRERLKCLGNAVVPQQFYPVFQAIADIEKGIIHG